MTVLLTGQLLSGKNRILTTRTGHRYAPQRFKDWRAEMVRQVNSQGFGKYVTMMSPVLLKVDYWPGDRRTRDVSGMLDAVFQVIVHAKLLEDDGLVWECLWRRHSLDKAYPRAQIEILELAPGVEIECKELVDA